MLRSGRIRSALTALFVVYGCAVPVAFASAASPAAAASLTGSPTTNVDPDPDADPLPAVFASSWIVVDGETGDILAEKDSQRELPPASTLKTLTVEALLPRLEANSQYLATYQDVNQRGTKTGIRAGESYSVIDLVKGMLIKSGNDTASALANAYGGWDPAIKTMNEEAARLGATNTHAMNPSGLDDREQMTSARDLVIIFREAIKNPDVRDVLSYKTTEIPSHGRMLTLVSYNRLLHQDYPGMIGAKLGFTPAAGRTLVLAAERNGHTIIVAAMRHGERMDHIGGDLLDWGFANRNKVTPVGQIPEPGPAPAIHPRAALQVNPDGTPLSGQESLLDQIATGNVATTDESGDAPNGGPSLLTIFGWLLIIGLAIVVALRVRVSIAEKRAAHRQQPPPAQVDLTTAAAESQSGHTLS